MEEPLVSILMPVYNRDKYIAASIESVLSQTYSNWELIIIDDGSTDSTGAVIKQFNDSRIKLISQRSNRGVANALNTGIALANGEFIGRLDSDDLAIESRFEKQVNFLLKNPGVDICGSWIRILDSDLILKYSQEHNDILSELLLSCPMGGPSVLLRKRVFEKFQFTPDMPFAEDYEFWSRVLFRFKSSNIPEPLVLYRRHGNQLTANQAIKKAAVKIKKYVNDKILDKDVAFSKKMIYKFLSDQSGYSKAEIDLFFDWCRALQEANNRKKIFPLQSFSRVVNVYRSRMIEEIFFRINPKLNLFSRLKLLLRLKFSEKRIVIVRKLREKVRLYLFLF